MIQPTKEEITKRVQKILEEKLNLHRQELTLDASLTHDLGADSLDTVEIVMELEREFDITIKTEEEEKIKTIQDSVSIIEKLLKQK